MTTRYRVSLGGVQMDSLDKNIVILDVSYAPITRNDTMTETVNTPGFERTSYRFQGQTVTVTFQLRIYDTKAKNAALQKINQWAAAQGNLVINDREGQYLPSVICTQFASLKSVRNWTDPMQLTFSSERVPFWLSNTEKVVTLSGKNAKGTLKMDGTVGLNNLVTVSVTATEVFKTLDLTVGSTKLSLKGLNVAAGKVLTVDYINQRYLRIRADGKSVLAQLDKGSSDNLQAACGASTSVAVVANGKVTAVFKGRGCWL